MQFVSASTGKKNSPLHNTASQSMQAAQQQWQNAMEKVKEPGKFYRVMRLVVAQLPVHPQYLDPGAFYYAELQQPLAFGSEPLTQGTMSAIGTAPPFGTLVRALLVTPLTSASSQKGAPVEALISRPVMENDRLIYPQGSRLEGSVLQVRAACHFHRNGQLRIAFHKLVLPDDMNHGASRGVEATIKGMEATGADHVRLDEEGGARATNPKSLYVTTGISVGLAVIGSGGRNDVEEGGPVAGGATAFKLVGIVVGLIVRSHTLGIVMSAYGGSRAIYSAFIGHGTDIAFPRNTAMDIDLGASHSNPMAP